LILPANITCFSKNGSGCITNHASRQDDRLAPRQDKEDGKMELSAHGVVLEMDTSGANQSEGHQHGTRKEDYIKQHLLQPAINEGIY